MVIAGRPHINDQKNRTLARQSSFYAGFLFLAILKGPEFRTIKFPENIKRLVA